MSLRVSFWAVVALGTFVWQACGEGIAPREMRELVAQRLSRLDKLRIEMTSKRFILPAGKSAFNRANWEEGRGGIAFPHRILLVRPDLLDENLVNVPEKGYAPLVTSVFDGGAVVRKVLPDKNGRTKYNVVEWDPQVSFYGSVPLLQVLDVHIQDSFVPQLNLLRLFDEYPVALVRGVGEVSTYTASIDHGPVVVGFEFDLNARGTPLRFKTVLNFQKPGLRPATWEMYTLRTQEVSGAEFPVESVVTVFNPNVVTTFGNVHYFEVTSVSVDPNLSPDDVRIVPELRNANVTVGGADGRNRARWYDANGSVVYDKEYLNPQSAVNGPLASRESLRWRWLIPAGSCAVAVLAVLGLRFVSARRRRQSGQP